MANIELALAEKAVRKLFNTLRDTVHFTKSGSSTGTFSASYNVGVRLSGGVIDLRDSPDEVKLNELDIIYDPLNVTLKVDIPEVCVGGFCILPNPFGGCLVRAPRLCLFSSNPDITIPLNLNAVIQSEISGAFNIKTKYFNNPDGVGLNQFQAAMANAADKWRFHLDLRWIDVDIIDIADTVGNLLDNIIDNFINGIFAGLPSWARDVLGWLLHGISDIIRGILDIGDDIGEWLSDLLGVSFGLFNFIGNAIANYFLNITPIYEFDNPYPIIQGPIPVLIPVSNLETDITNDEFIIRADI